MMNLGRLGIPGVIGVGLLLFCLSFGLGTVVPARETRQRLIDEESRLAAATLTSHASHVELATGQNMPPLATAPDLLLSLSKLGDRGGLPMDSVSYQLTQEEGIARYDVSLNLKGTYKDLRGFLRDALALSSSAYVAELSLQRSSAVEASIGATIHLTYLFTLP